MDKEVKFLLDAELKRQQESIVLIASENYTSEEVMLAQGSVATNKYAEGYPGKRYYAGCQVLDKVEELAISRAKKLFGVDYANVQPHSGAQANSAVFAALLEPGDTIMGLELSDGGHLSHGSKVNVSGQYYNSVSYKLNLDTESLDYDAIEELAKKSRPKLIIAGYSAYSLTIDWARFRKIADSVGAYLLADIAHISGLVATGNFPSPSEYADVITTTTHKSLRGPRGGMIMVPKNQDLAKAINKGIFPGTQGGPLMHTVAAKAICFYEALQPDFANYQRQILENAKTMAKCFQDAGFHVISGGTATHLFLVKLDNITGKDAESILESANIIVNKNTVPGETRSPFITSGIRIGVPAITTRGFLEEDVKYLVSLIIQVLNGYKDEKLISQVREKVALLCKKFPIYEKKTSI